MSVGTLLLTAAPRAYWERRCTSLAVRISTLWMRWVCYSDYMGRKALNIINGSILQWKQRLNVVVRAEGNVIAHVLE